MTTINMHMKFEIEIPKQTWLTLRKPCHLQSPETEKSNMAARRPFWKMTLLKNLQSPETEKSNMAARRPFWKMTLLKINRLLPIYISIVPLKFEVDIQSQSKVRVRKPKNPIWPPGYHFESDVAENQ